MHIGAKKKTAVYVNTYTSVYLYQHVRTWPVFVNTCTRAYVFETYELGHEDLCISILCEHW